MRPKKKEAAVLPQRPESREETPKEGICDKSMPHRNNIHLRPMKCKVFLRPGIEIADSATFLPQRGAGRFRLCCKILMGNNALHVGYLSAPYRLFTN
jgi:hypothetical protein